MKTNKIKFVQGLLLAMMALATGACSNAPNCEEPEFYEFAEVGQRIDPPDDLDALPEFKEMVIPEASPQPQRTAEEGCLDRPPVLRVEEADE